MNTTKGLLGFLTIFSAVFLSSCSTYSSSHMGNSTYNSGLFSSYASRLPESIETRGEKTVMVDPRVHTWGAYDADGHLIRAGLAVAGSGWCGDLGHPCHTAAGTFRIQSMGGADCKSTIFPLGRGGAPMPYCMFFHGGQALHGEPPYGLGEANMSHGCVRMSVSDAEWLRYNFVNIGTKVIIHPY